MSEHDKPYRSPTEGHRGYGVTLHWKAGNSLVAARCHFPHVMVDSRAPTGMTEAYPADFAYMLWFSGTQEAIVKLDETISDLTARRDALIAHLEEGTAIVDIPSTGPEMPSSQIQDFVVQVQSGFSL